MNTSTASKQACCHQPAKAMPVTVPVSKARLGAASTLHCLTGCAIGEVIGLTLGVSLGLSPWVTMTMATALAYLSGFLLGLRPLLKTGMHWRAALQAIWLGEVISIGVMELAMNFTDYHLGGMTAASVFSPAFWTGLLLALPAGFLAAWPVNVWLLSRQIKKPCH